MDGVSNAWVTSVSVTAAELASFCLERRLALGSLDVDAITEWADRYGVRPGASRPGSERWWRQVHLWRADPWCGLPAAAQAGSRRWLAEHPGPQQRPQRRPRRERPGQLTLFNMTINQAHGQGPAEEPAAARSTTITEEVSDMDARTYLGGSYLKAAHVARAMRVTIAGVSEELVGAEKERKLVVYFEEIADRPLGLNSTNLERLIDLFGEDTEGWVGQVVELRRETCDFRGERVPCLRVHPASHAEEHRSGAGPRQGATPVGSRVTRPVQHREMSLPEPPPGVGENAPF